MSSLTKALIYGCASAGLYAALFLHADALVEFARRTREGEKIWFVVPIVVAFAFSYVHGAFTGHFWDALGVRPAEKPTRDRE